MEDGRPGPSIGAGEQDRISLQYVGKSARAAHDLTFSHLLGHNFQLQFLRVPQNDQ